MRLVISCNFLAFCLPHKGGLKKRMIQKTTVAIGKDLLIAPFLRDFSPMSGLEITAGSGSGHFLESPIESSFGIKTGIVGQGE